MKLRVLNRKAHHWLSAAIALPVLIVLCSGVLLQLKKDLPWVQPPEHRGAGKVPTLSFERLLEISQGVPEAEIRGWADVSRVDTRPSRGLHKVQARNGWELQIDAQSGELLQAAYRRSDLIEAIHDGSWFHERVKYWIFLPSGIGLLLLWLTGMYLFGLPHLVRWRRRRRDVLPRRQPPEAAEVSRREAAPGHALPVGPRPRAAKPDVPTGSRRARKARSRRRQS
jgi:uncharacterized iron-regulated membrane protein